MRTILSAFLIILATASISAQNHHNLKGGFAAEGYDVVAYFKSEPAKGNKKFTHSYKGIKYKFASQTNLEAFKENPDAYIPEYGGFCAYAIAKDGKKVSVDPETFLIENGKLYLFYNSWGINTLKKWNEEGPVELTVKADKNWTSIVNSN